MIDFILREKCKHKTGKRNARLRDLFPVRPFRSVFVFLPSGGTVNMVKYTFLLERWLSKYC